MEAKGMSSTPGKALSFGGGYFCTYIIHSLISGVILIMQTQLCPSSPHDCCVSC
jgi:hypothetical protein